MRISSLVVAFSLGLLGTVACTVSSTGSSSGASGGSSSGGSSSGGSSSGGGSDASADSSTNPPASSKEVDVAINGTCPAFTACGGSLDGTYDYASGCVTDIFAQAKAQCPTLDTSGVKATVKGSLYFKAPALTRDGVTKVSGQIVFPASCTAGQCAAVQAALKGAFDTITCTGASACTCTISKTELVKNATTYSLAGSTVTTGDGETYEICATGSDLKYSGKAAAEDGVWGLTKR
jgi:hypothetical protein